MASRLIAAKSCDPCAELGLGDVVAHHSHRIRIDDGPVKDQDYCDRCEAGFQRFVGLYLAGGQEPPSPAREQRLRAKAAAVQTEVLPVEESPGEAASPEKPRALAVVPALKKERPARKVKGTLPNPPVVCTSIEAHANGQPCVVTYGSRNEHARKVHNGAHVWDLTWEDPEGLLKHPCTSHVECMKTGLAFLSPLSVQRHREHVQLTPIAQ